ncbi:Spx/MgsR family RNA polymerase-binding regulatory protein [Eggerthellaceae bacterium zg-893]|nr:Spx/MgsR family RNA polymerase-binding regulatory protein [Eggerthellaceae bacterium zg-893]
MPVLFIEYPKCSTCKKAKKWLEDNDIAFEDRDIVAQNPTAEELRAWHEASGLPLRRFFNTSGMLYREQGVKQKLDDGMTDEEAYALLASNGMLVKRPLLIVDGVPATPGFKEADWRATLGQGNAK